METVNVAKTAIKVGINAGVMFGTSALVRKAFEQFVEPENKFQVYTFGMTRYVLSAYITDVLMDHTNNTVDELFLAASTFKEQLAVSKLVQPTADEEAEEISTIHVQD